MREFDSFKNIWTDEELDIAKKFGFSFCHCFKCIWYFIKYQEW